MDGGQNPGARQIEICAADSGILGVERRQERPHEAYETHLRFLRYFGKAIALEISFNIPSPGYAARVDGEG
jgi:hypothetical protein